MRTKRFDLIWRIYGLTAYLLFPISILLKIRTLPAVISWFFIISLFVLPFLFIYKNRIFDDTPKNKIKKILYLVAGIAGLSPVVFGILQFILYSYFFKNREPEELVGIVVPALIFVSLFCVICIFVALILDVYSIFRSTKKISGNK
jgi:hypothetical protein